MSTFSLSIIVTVFKHADGTYALLRRDMSVKGWPYKASTVADVEKATTFERSELAPANPAGEQFLLDAEKREALKDFRPVSVRMTISN